MNKQKQTAQPDKLRKDLHVFVDRILAHCECPSMWPLTREEQANFVRKVIYQARQIRNKKEYQAEAIAISAEDLAKAS